MLSAHNFAEKKIKFSEILHMNRSRMRKKQFFFCTFCVAPAKLLREIGYLYEAIQTKKKTGDY
jgi:hypothetical protein